ncbi:polyglutamine-binding protein 1 isoform X1 [Hydra vulgaris]|uniref:Polyglutamine-binding protein 1 n=1 Tax=Hydra vulgaris TaxID=6087 RepID=T2MIU0_HYDVU|nr:polyglutamine-binding protein 1-like [Hydra vulgaris]
MTLPAALQARLKKRGLIVPEPEKPKEPIEQPKPSKSFKSQPLPPGWFKVEDPVRSHDYFWNVHTNQVSWRHPNDPRAEITYPAAWQQKTDMGKTDSRRTNEIKEDRNKLKVNTGKHPSLLKANRQKERGFRKGKSKDDDALDPMDPASYSDVGRGTWSTGLKEDTDVKTGVDTTANGPLFQQRPYPSPGDILRRNRKQVDPSDA